MRDATIMPTLELTDQQKAIVESVAAGKNTAVLALAGTGKTSTLAAVAQHLAKVNPRARLLYLAFNKVTADEAKSRMPRNVQAITSNAMAHRAVPQHMADRLEPRGLRAKQLVDMLGLRQAIVYKGTRITSGSPLAQLVLATMDKWCQSAAPEPSAEHVPDPSLGDRDIRDAMEKIVYLAGESMEGDDEARAHAEQQALRDAWGHVTDKVIEIVKYWWEQVCDDTSDFPVSFDQEVKYWALSNVRFDEPGSGANGPVDIVLLDEAQDTNEVLGDLVARQNIQKVIVGDQNQQIYAWRGSVDYLNRVDVEERLALSASWRFGPQVAAVANAYLTLLGTTERVEGKGAPAQIGEIARPDAIIARTNAGLLEAAFTQDGVGQRVGIPKGMKFELKSLAQTVGHLRDGMRRPPVLHPDLKDFREWDEVLKEADEAPSGPVARLVKLVSGMPTPVLLDLVERLVDVDVKVKAAKTWDVVVTTAHKAKGLEWDTVRIAGDFPQPRLDDDGVKQMPGSEELRLAYVAVTRAKTAMDVGSLAYGLKETRTRIPRVTAPATQSVPPVVQEPARVVSPLVPLTSGAATHGPGEGADAHEVFAAELAQQVAQGASPQALAAMVRDFANATAASARLDAADELLAFAATRENPGLRLAAQFVKNTARRVAKGQDAVAS